MSGFADQASSALRIAAAYKVPASPFFYINTRFCACAPAD